MSEVQVFAFTGLACGIAVVLLLIVALLKAAHESRWERNEWELFAELETDFQARVGSPDPRDEWARDDEFRVRAAADTGICAEVENHLREAAGHESS